MLARKKRGGLAPESLIRLSDGLLAADKLAPGDIALAVIGRNHLLESTEVADLVHLSNQHFFSVTASNKTIKASAEMKLLSFTKQGKYYQNHFLSIKDLAIGNLLAVVSGKHLSFTAISEIVAAGQGPAIIPVLGPGDENNFIADGFVTKP